MKKLLRWIVFIPAGAALVLFLIANRAPVALSFDPVSVASPAIATPPLPLWLWLVSSMLVGLACGALGMWASGRGLRRRARADRLELKALKKSLESGGASRPAEPS